MNRHGRAGGIVVTIVMLLGSLASLLPAPAEAIEVGWGLPTLLARDANYPGLVVDSDGHATVVWDEGRSLWSNRFVPGLGWGGSGTLIPGGISHYDDMAVDDAGNVIIVGSGAHPTQDGPGVYVVRLVPAEGWGIPEWTRAPEGDACYAGEARICTVGQARIAVDTEGNVLVAWVQITDRLNRSLEDAVWANSYVPSAGWGAPVRLWTGHLPGWSSPLLQVAGDPARGAIAVWSGYWQRNLTTWTSQHDADIGWGVATHLGEEARTPIIGMNQAGNALLVYYNNVSEGADGNLKFHSLLGRRYVEDVGWQDASSIRELPDNETSFKGLPQVAVDADGDVIVVWGETGGIYGNRFIPDVGWQGATRLSASEPDWGLRIASNSKGTAILTWVQTSWVDDDERYQSQLWVRRFMPDVGWEEATAIQSKSDCASSTCLENARIEIDSMDSTWVAWGQWTRGIDGNQLDVWATRFVSLSSAILELDEELRQTQDRLGETLDALIGSQADLQDTKDALEDAKDGLDATTGALTDADQRATILFALQAAFAAAAAVLFVLYLNVRRAGLGAAGDPLTPSARPRDTAARSVGRTRGGWPASPLDAPMRLTTKERILLHLLDFARNDEGQEAPPAVTRMGIASGAWVDPRHFAQYIRPLAQKGLVEKRSAHVRGVLQRRNVSALTATGMRKALGIRDRVKSAVVRVKDSSGVKEASIADVLAATRGSRSILSIVHESIENGIVDLKK